MRSKPAHPRPAGKQTIIRTLAGDSPDAYSDFDRPDAVAVEENETTASPNGVRITLPPHSVTSITVNRE